MELGRDISLPPLTGSASRESDRAQDDVWSGEESPPAAQLGVAEGAARRARRGRSYPIISKALHRLYGIAGRWVRGLILRVIIHLEGGDMYSVTLRQILLTYYDVSIGMYTNGGCFTPGNMGPGTTIGRYCSIAKDVHTFTANHPMNLVSSHAVFFNPALGLAKERIAPRTRLTIGNDVWIGYGARILPSVSTIGDGAIIGAGAVINKNVPPYAIVTGNPGRVVRYRFSNEIIEKLRASRWWDKPLEDLLSEFSRFQIPLEGEAIR